MTDINIGWVTRLALVFLLASTMVIAGGSSIVAAQDCEPEAGNVSGCEGDVGTVEAIGGNAYSIANAALVFVGLTSVAGGLTFWASGGFSAALKSKGGFLIAAGVIVLIASFAFEPLLGLVDWVATNGV